MLTEHVHVTATDDNYVYGYQVRCIVCGTTVEAEGETEVVALWNGVTEDMDDE